jgi:hypothetical protein
MAGQKCRSNPRLTGSGFSRFQAPAHPTQNKKPEKKKPWFPVLMP